MIKLHDDAMHVEEQVVVWLLKRLCNGMKLALVATAVVRLGLTRHRAYEVGVNAHGEADHIHRLLNVGGPVAALLVVINARDFHVMLLFPSGR